MILDKFTMFSDDQAVLIPAGSTYSTNIIDLGDDSSLVQSKNEKGNLQILALCTEGFTGGTSIKVQVTESDSSTFLSSTVIADSGAIGYATAKAGYEFNLGTLPRVSKQYLRLTYTVAGNTMTTGKITAGLILDKQTANV